MFSFRIILTLFMVITFQLRASPRVSKNWRIPLPTTCWITVILIRRTLLWLVDMVSWVFVGAVQVFGLQLNFRSSLSCPKMRICDSFLYSFPYSSPLVLMSMSTSYSYHSVSSRRFRVLLFLRGLRAGSGGGAAHLAPGIRVSSVGILIKLCVHIGVIACTLWWVYHCQSPPCTLSHLTYHLFIVCLSVQIC